MLFLILGSAGSGKTTLCSLLERNLPGVKIYTTRPRRIDDKDNYVFVSKSQFLSLYRKKKILTKVKILGNYYGLENDSYNSDKVNVVVADGFTIKQLQRKRINYIAIYLDVPLEVCKNRLMLRGDGLDSINKKIALERLMSKKEQSLCAYSISNCDAIEKTYDEAMELIYCNLVNAKCKVVY